MPNRLLRDWTNSERINGLSVNAERLFTRLIMKADDYGCFYADIRILKANLFPLQLDGVREADISRWITECEKAGLIVLYEADKKKYLEIVDFKQRLRNKNRKFPVRLTLDGQLTDNCPPEVEVEVEYEVEERVLQQEESPPADLSKSNLFRQPVIPTRHQVWEVFSKNNGTKEMAKSFWDKHESTGWFINGSPIVSYTALAQRFITNWKSNEGKVKNIVSSPSSAPLKRANEL